MSGHTLCQHKLAIMTQLLYVNACLVHKTSKEPMKTRQ